MGWSSVISLASQPRSVDEAADSGSASVTCIDIESRSAAPIDLYTDNHSGCNCSPSLCLEIKIPLIITGFLAYFTRSNITEAYNFNICFTLALFFTVLSVVVISLLLTLLLSEKYCRVRFFAMIGSSRLLKSFHNGYFQGALGGIMALATGFYLLARVMVGQCSESCNMWQSQSCNPVASAKSIPHDQVMICYLLPILIQLTFKGTKVQTAALMWLITTVFVFVSLTLVKGWFQLWTILYSVFFLYISYGLDQSYSKNKCPCYLDAQPLRSKGQLVSGTKKEKEDSESLISSLQAVSLGVDRLLQFNRVTTQMTDEECHALCSTAVACNAAISALDHLTKQKPSDNRVINRDSEIYYSGSCVQSVMHESPVPPHSSLPWCTEKICSECNVNLDVEKASKGMLTTVCSGTSWSGQSQSCGDLYGCRGVCDIPPYSPKCDLDIELSMLDDLQQEHRLRSASERPTLSENMLSKSLRSSKSLRMSTYMSQDSFSLQSGYVESVSSSSYPYFGLKDWSALPPITQFNADHSSLAFMKKSCDPTCPGCDCCVITICESSTDSAVAVTPLTDHLSPSPSLCYSSMYEYESYPEMQWTSYEDHLLQSLTDDCEESVNITVMDDLPLPFPTSSSMCALQMYSLLPACAEAYEAVTHYSLLEPQNTTILDLLSSHTTMKSPARQSNQVTRRPLEGTYSCPYESHTPPSLFSDSVVSSGVVTPKASKDRTLTPALCDNDFYERCSWDPKDISTNKNLEDSPGISLRSPRKGKVSDNDIMNPFSEYYIDSNKIQDTEGDQVNIAIVSGAYERSLVSSLIGGFQPIPSDNCVEQKSNSSSDSSLAPFCLGGTGRRTSALRSAPVRLSVDTMYGSSNMCMMEEDKNPLSAISEQLLWTFKKDLTTALEVYDLLLSSFFSPSGVETHQQGSNPFQGGKLDNMIKSLDATRVLVIKASVSLCLSIDNFSMMKSMQGFR